MRKKSIIGSIQFDNLRHNLNVKINIVRLFPFRN